VTEEASNNPLTGTYWANLGNSNYATAEQVIVQLWEKIVSVSKIEKVPPTLVAAILLQNMRSMNYFDIEFDGGVFAGKSIGISQTPYYILQKIARDYGIQSLQWPKGTELSEARSKEILFDAELNPAVAAAHVKMLTEAANKWVKQSTASETMKKRLMDLFDIDYFNGKSVLDFRMKEIAATVGYNVDQWQMVGTPEALPVDISSGYRRGIVVALEDIYNSLDQYGQLRPELYLTPRNYVEDVAFPGAVLEIVSPSDRLKPYRWFKAGDIIPNFYPDPRNLVKRPRQ